MNRPRHDAKCRDQQRAHSERAGSQAAVRHENGGGAAPSPVEGSGVPSRIRDLRRHAGLSRYDAGEPGQREGYSASGWRFGSDSGPDDWSYVESRAIDRGTGHWVGSAEPRSRDQRIREEVSDRLADDRSVGASDVIVDVQKGGVTLTGWVPSGEQKRRAGDVADSISGVKEVINNIRVSGEDQHPSSMRTNGAGRKQSSRSSSRTVTGGPGHEPTIGGHPR